MSERVFTAKPMEYIDGVTGLLLTFAVSEDFCTLNIVGDGFSRDFVFDREGNFDGTGSHGEWPNEE